jgi:hypothetical protein
MCCMVDAQGVLVRQDQLGFRNVWRYFCRESGRCQYVFANM